MLSNSRPRRSPVTNLTRLALEHPRAVVLGALVTGAISLLLTAFDLEFHTQRSDLLNPRSEFHQRWLEYVREFGNPEEVVVVVAGQPASVRQAMDRVSAELLRYPQHYCDVYDRFDSRDLLSHGLYYLPPEQLKELARFVDEVVPLLQRPSVGLVELLSAFPPASPPSVRSVRLLSPGRPRQDSVGGLRGPRHCSDCRQLRSPIDCGSNSPTIKRCRTVTWDS